MYFLRADDVITETDLLFVTKRKYAKHNVLIVTRYVTVKKMLCWYELEFLSKD